jgi:hypothetical protein
MPQRSLRRACNTRKGASCLTLYIRDWIENVDCRDWNGRRSRPCAQSFGSNPFYNSFASAVALIARVGTQIRHLRR